MIHSHIFLPTEMGGFSGDFFITMKVDGLNFQISKTYQGVYQYDRQRSWA